MSSTLELNPLGAPTRLPAVDNHACVSAGITAQSEALRLWVPEANRNEVFGYDERPGFARFPKSQTEVAFNGKLILTDSSVSRTIGLAGLKYGFPEVQTFPNGDILVASARCHRWKDGSFELNAKVYRADGGIRAEFCLGDGMQHVAIDAVGRIWVGYSDEGVYGNYGWGVGSGTAPIGAWGLACFDNKGTPVWEYKPLPGLDPISECYVLNCADDAVWACYYTDFPIIRIDWDSRITAWQSDLSGPSQMAVNGDRLLVYGGYIEKSNDCWLLRLGDSIAERIAQVRLRLPDKIPLDKATVIGRGKFLHVFADDLWFRFEVPLG